MLIKHLTRLHILLKRCPDCGFVTIYGGISQVNWIRGEAGAFFIARCQECGHEDRRDYVEPDEVIGGLGI